MNIKRIKAVARSIRMICSCHSREAIKRAQDMERRQMLDDLSRRIQASFTTEEWAATKERCEKMMRGEAP